MHHNFGGCTHIFSFNAGKASILWLISQFIINDHFRKILGSPSSFVIPPVSSHTRTNVRLPTVVAKLADIIGVLIMYNQLIN